MWNVPQPRKAASDRLSQQHGDAPKDVSIAADIFGSTLLDGTVASVNAASALNEMHNEISKIPVAEKAALFHAQRVTPHLLDDEHVLHFLWAENFCAASAARRIVRYWNDRFRLFGRDKFCLPLTLKGALKDDSLALSRGYVQLLPETDTAGRAVMYVDWSCHEPTIGYSEESMHRVFWYMAHVAIEDANVLQRGVVMLIYPQEARLDQFDHSLWNSIADSCKNSLPIRWRSTHIVHPNRFFSIIHPIFMSSLPSDVQDRVVVHSGTKMKVLANLLRYSLPWDRIPSDIGGCVDLDFEQWLSDRMAIEDNKSTQSSSNVDPTLLDTALQQRAPVAASPVTTIPVSPAQGGTINVNMLGNQALGLLSKLTLPPPSNNFSEATEKIPLDRVDSPEKNGSKSLSQSEPVDSSEGAINLAKRSNSDKGPAKGPKTLLKSGRKSDPRMDRAVQAKLDDPKMSLVDALRKGGFEFPVLSNSSTPQYTVVDSDNVKITQRKNQLLRRLRTTKKKNAG